MAGARAKYAPRCNASCITTVWQMLGRTLPPRRRRGNGQQGRIFRLSAADFHLGAARSTRVSVRRTSLDTLHERPSDTRPTPVLKQCPIGSRMRKLASRFGVSAEAVRQLALRRKWPRRRPNDDPFGRVQVLIPDDAEIRPRTGVEHPSERSLDTRPNGMLDAPREAIERERERADRAEMAADLERERADQAEKRADTADADRRAADARADAAAARADAADADRRAAQARADAAEVRAQRAEDRTTELRDRLGTTQAELAAARESEDRARAQAHAAQDEAAALRQAADVQRALGRWARLRLAWRGG